MIQLYIFYLVKSCIKTRLITLDNVYFKIALLASLKDNVIMK